MIKRRLHRILYKITEYMSDKYKMIAKFIGYSYIAPTPLFYMYKPRTHLVKGHEIRRILDLVQPGDLIFRKHMGYLSDYIITGFWSHVGLYVGNNMMIHATGVGILKEDILDFLRTDCAAVKRIIHIDQFDLNKVFAKAEEYHQRWKHGEIGYDYFYRPDNKDLYCTELINNCYDNYFDDCYSETYGKMILVPDTMYESDKLETIIEIIKTRKDD